MLFSTFFSQSFPAQLGQRLGRSLRLVLTHTQYYKDS